MKAILITGASSGIGEVFARRLAAKEHNLILVARSEDKLAALSDELMLEHDVSVHYIAADLSKPGSDLEVFEETERHGFEVEWLINNAGFGSMGEFTELDLESELAMISLNISALVALTHRYLPQMVERGDGKIINVSSTASFQPVPYMATYAATKAFVTSFSEALAEENMSKRVQVFALCPGTTETNFFAASKIDNPIKVKGVHTAEYVVDVCLKAIAKGKTSVVPGLVNYFVTTAGKVAPGRFVARTVGKMVRSHREKHEG